MRKRLFYAIYCMSAKASATFGRPTFIRLADVDVPEPFAVDDEFITIDGVGVQPADKPSVQAGFVAAIRLHMLLERTLVVFPHSRGSSLTKNLPPVLRSSTQWAVTLWRNLLPGWFSLEVDARLSLFRVNTFSTISPLDFREIGRSPQQPSTTPTQSDSSRELELTLFNNSSASSLSDTNYSTTSNKVPLPRRRRVPREKQKR